MPALLETSEYHSVKTPALNPNATAFLDLVRAIAASLVLLDHGTAIFQTGIAIHTGSLGVCIFFILSGFLIMQSSLLRLRRPKPHFAPYMIDRVARIFTAYVPVLIIVALINGLVDLGQWSQAGVSTGPAAFVGNLLMLQDYPLFQAGQRLIGDTFYIRPYNAAEPFWTIPIEFWTYVIFGLAFFGLIARERIGLIGLLAGLIALPVVVWNAVAGGGNGLTLVWLIGATGGYVWVSAWHRNTRRRGIGLVVGAVAAVCLLGRGMKFGWNFQDFGLVLCLTLLVFASISILDDLPVLPVWPRRIAMLLASYSYTLYLVHNTVLVLTLRLTAGGPLARVAFPIALIAAHVVAIFLYLLFERHYRHVGVWLKRRFPQFGSPIIPSIVIDQPSQM